MKARISIITIGVDDLQRSLDFYRDGLGFATQGIIGQEFEHGSVVFFDLAYGLKLALFSRQNIAHDSGIPIQAPSSTEFILAHNVSSAAEVDILLKQAELAGGKIVKPAFETFYGGYAGYFQDPDAHLWEIAYNPAILPEDSK